MILCHAMLIAYLLDVVYSQTFVGFCYKNRSMTARDDFLSVKCVSQITLDDVSLMKRFDAKSV